MVPDGLAEAEGEGCGARPQAKVKGLGLGADDFITKPFDKSELLARMQAITRRSKGFSQPTLRLGSIELNLDSREVTVDGQEVHLTGKEYSILELLVLRKGMVLTKEAFLNHLYGGMDEPEMKIIDVFICKLRKKLANVSGGNDFIETVWARGYVLSEPSVAISVSGEWPRVRCRATSLAARSTCRCRSKASSKAARIPSISAGKSFNSSPSSPGMRAGGTLR